MLLCYLPIKQGIEVALKLCIVPDKTDEISLPIEIDKLDLTSAAVVRVGADEACTVSEDETDNQLVISALVPARIFLTPNLPQYPGMNTQHIKIVKYNDGAIRTFYSRDKIKWEEWIANQERK